MKKILLPTDFSDNAWNAIFTAIKLYANIKCQFYLLHAYEPKAINKLGRKSQMRLGVIYDSLSENSQRELQKIQAYLEKNHKNPNHSFESISKSATLEKAIEEITATHDLDLIVMGTQGATGAKEVFMGSNTVRVLKKVKRLPILAIPSYYNFQKLKHAVFPTDFIRNYEKFELLPLTELLSLWDAELQILYVAVEFVLNDIQKTNKNLLIARLTESGIKHCFSNVKFDANIARSIENFIGQNFVDIIAMIRYHHTFWEKVIGEPVIKKIAFHSTVPVLILPEH